MKTPTLISVMIVVFMANLVLASEELVYSGYTNAPSFYCPEHADLCRIYQVSDKMARPINPVLVKECEPGPCTYFNQYGIDFFARFSLFFCKPGDVCSSAYRFEGYAVYENREENGEDVGEEQSGSDMLFDGQYRDCPYWVEYCRQCPREYDYCKVWCSQYALAPATSFGIAQSGKGWFDLNSILYSFTSCPRSYFFRVIGYY